MHARFGLPFLLSLSAALSRAAEPDEVPLPPTQAKTLALNGTATRTKFFLPVYLIGMYTNLTLSRTESLERRRAQVMNPKVQKRFDIVLRRDLPAPLMLDGIREGFKKNCSDPIAQSQATHPCETLRPAFERLEKTILDIGRFKKGDRFTLTVDEKGVEVFLKRAEASAKQPTQTSPSPAPETEAQLAQINSPNFAAFLPALWLVNPPDGQKEITQNLLGGAQVISGKQKQETQTPH